MSRLYPTDTKPRTGYQRTPRVPGPFHVERRLRWDIIALPIIGTLAWLLASDAVAQMVKGWLA